MGDASPTLTSEPHANARDGDSPTAVNAHSIDQRRKRRAHDAISLYGSGQAEGAVQTLAILETLWQVLADARTSSDRALRAGRGGTNEACT